MALGAYSDTSRKQPEGVAHDEDVGAAAEGVRVELARLQVGVGVAALGLRETASRLLVMMLDCSFCNLQ